METEKIQQKLAELRELGVNVELEQPDKNEPEPQPTEEPEEETTPVIEKAERAGLLLKEQLDRMEKIVAHKALGGQTEAGLTLTPKEETPQEYAQKVLRGEVSYV